MRRRAIAALAVTGLMLATASLATAQAPAPAVKKRPAAVHSAPVASYKDIKFPPLRQIEIPKVDTYALPNGLRVYLLENHELPLVSGFALVRTGNLFDPPDKIGLATMTGMVMRTGGTSTADGDALDEKLENVAASVESQIGESSGTVSFSCLKDNTDEVLGVFRDLLTSPEFRSDKIELAKTRLRSAISRRNDDAHGIAQREFDRIVYGPKSPYGWIMEYEDINRIGRDDLMAFYRRYFFPQNIMLAVYGDFQSAGMKAKLEELFAGWTSQQPAVPPFPPVDAKSAPGVYLAAKTDVTQTFFTIGHLGGLLKDKDYPALDVMADILGGGFSSRLVQRVRTRLGDAYDISAVWSANYDHPGVFQIAGSTKSVSTVETIQAIKEEVDRIRTSEVTDQELETAKQTALNGFVFNFDTRAKTIRRVMNYEYFGYPKDFIFQYQKGVAAVTKADILRVAKQHIRPPDLVVVAVGNQKEFVKPLDTLGKAIPIDLTIPEPKPEITKADPASLAKGRQMLARVQQALGGADKLGAVKDFVQTADFQIDPSMGGLKLKQINRWVAPNHFRQEIELPFGKLSSYTDGSTGWQITPQGEQALAGPLLKQAQGELFRIYFRLLLSDRDPDRTVNAAGPNVIEVSDKQGQAARITINESTGLPLKISYQGPQSPVDEEWIELKDSGGLKMPSKIIIHQGGRKFAEVSVQGTRLNTGATAEQLSRRQ